MKKTDSSTSDSKQQDVGKEIAAMRLEVGIPKEAKITRTSLSSQFRRNSIATTHLEITPEYQTTERSSAYNDLAEITTLAKKVCRRNSMTKVESEVKLRHSLASMMDYQDKNETLKKLKERFTQSRTSALTSRSSSGRASQPPSVIGSVVDTAAGTKSDEDLSRSADLTSHNTPGLDSSSIPLSLVHQTIQRKRKYNLERDNLIESLVNFSCHTPRAVLEDLISQELQLWERPDDLKKMLQDEEKREIQSTQSFSDGSLSSLSTDNENDNDKNRDSDDMVKSIGSNKLPQPRVPSNSLPNFKERDSALLFVDINGFTKLSTLLDVESLSKVINSYFEMIVSEVILHRGDILKFAGDAFFAEWRPGEEEGSVGGSDDVNGLKRLNASISSADASCFSISSTGPSASTCVWQAAKCAMSIVKKFSDYHVTTARETSFDANAGLRSEAMLNVHCGIGAGRLVGLHVGDYREGYDDDDEGQDEDVVELRREYLFLGDAINQVSQAAHLASDGEVMASPDAIRALTVCCELSPEVQQCEDPVCIASRDKEFLSLEPKQASMLEYLPDANDTQTPVYQNLRRHCVHLHRTALSRLHLQMALYVHPVVRGDELAITQRAKTMQKVDAPKNRHLAEAELRSVYTMFIKALVSPSMAGPKEKQLSLYKILGKIMHVTSRELDRYSGQLRQFIVDDKGVVLIATFGLRGSTFPNLVANNALPATFDIHRALKEELGVENRIGATFGMVYCGVVGGVRRHEFSVMGAPVNLAARLMDSRMNTGILVDEAVRAQADARFAFASLPPVTAKGYDKPVAILEPLHAISSKRKKGSSVAFAGRSEERNEIIKIANAILENPTATKSSVVNVIGESGIGKSALGISIMNEVKMECLKKKKKVVVTRSTSTETEQRIPLCAFRKVFLGAIRELCLNDGSITFGDDKGDRENGTRRDGVDGDSDEQRDVSGNLPSREHRRFSFQDTRLPYPQRPAQEARRSFMAMGGPGMGSPGMGAPGMGMGMGPPGMVGTPVMSRLSKAAHRSSGVRPQRAPAMRHERHDSLRHTHHAHETTCRRGSAATPLSRPPTMKSRTKSHGPGIERKDSNGSLTRPTAIPYLDKLIWACDELDFPSEYADLVGSQFLGIDSAEPVTHVNGDVPQMTQLVDFVVQAYMRITNFADLVLVFIDDFQWVDSFTWKVIRTLGQTGKNLLLMCAMRSHDKQAMRRMSTAVNSRVEITLGPLYLRDIKELIGSVLRYGESTIDDQLCTEIYQRTGGLPVYVIELLEDIKRNRKVLLNEDGVLRLSPESQLEKMRMENTALVMKESLLNRFDALDVRVRQVLQTCAVLGNFFALSDLFRVHPELEEVEIEQSLNAAIDEMILVEIVEEADDDKSIYSNSTGEPESKAYSKTSTAFNVLGDRYFQFSHDMWRNNVLTTMLKERKIELHRLIAEAMEKDQVLILERSDIARLLTLFAHWKSCGDFRKAAPLALAVGIRLNEWELSAQSLDLYQDALDMCFESVELSSNRFTREQEMLGDWVKVAATPDVLDLIVRLHIRIAESQRLMGDLGLCASTFQDAYTILNSSSGTNRSLMVPIMSGLCSAKSEFGAYDEGSLREQELLIQKFVQAAQDEGNVVHLSRALSMEATFFAQRRNFQRALQDQEVLQMVYKMEKHSNRIVEQYQKDYAAECFSQSILWYYLMGDHYMASTQADFVIQRHLTFQKPLDIDSKMVLLLPALLVLKSIGRAVEADYIMKKYIINVYHEWGPCPTHWVETFNPICYLLEIAKMEEENRHESAILASFEAWVFDDSNTYYSPQHLRLAHTVMGEICLRLGSLKGPEDSMREKLFERAMSFVAPITLDSQSEPFLVHSANAVLDAAQSVIQAT